LMLTPSFIATSDAGTGIGYTGFRIRGTDANRTNVTVNGIPYNDAESHSVYLVDMPDFASSLNSVQVQRGVGTSTNGASAFGASINMQTETLNPVSYAEIGTSVGSFNTMKNTLKAGTGLINNFAVDVRLSNVVSDGFIDRASANMKSYFVSVGYYSNKTMLKFMTFGGKEKTYQAWNGVDLDNYPRTYNELGKYEDSNGNTQFYKNQTDDYGQYHYQLHLTQIISSSLNLNAALHYTRGIGSYEEYKTNREYAEYGLTPAIADGEPLEKTDLVRQKWLDNHFGGATFSLNYQKEKYSLIVGGAANKYAGDHYGKVIWVRDANNLNIDHQYYFNKSSKTDANIYGKMNYHLFNNLLTYIDLQYRYIQLNMNGKDDKYDAETGTMRVLSNQKPFHFFNPKVGLSYKINTANNVFASFAVANREPNRNNYTDAGPNEKPTNERLYDTELGYNHQSDGFSFGANVYYMKYKNQLILNGKMSEIGEPLTSNIPDSYRTGIELAAGVKIIKGLRWDGNLNVSRNKILNFTEYVDMYDADWNWTGTKVNDFEKTDISYSPGVIANSIISYSYRNFETAFNSTYVGKQYLDNTSNNNRSIDPYFVNNLRIGYLLKLNKLKSIDFNFLINNLLNSKYETNGYISGSYYLDSKRINEKRYFPQAGINYLASITFKF
ncbi:MAG: TonB-dependent Receptor Plug Domain protein, partial [Bacteroidetes bacterium]|nr:TonB-dependent Receptor Plug Domain protein [Bacteroidota bacterium]